MMRRGFSDGAAAGVSGFVSKIDLLRSAAGDVALTSKIH
jgi:hypothetical protein